MNSQNKNKNKNKKWEEDYSRLLKKKRKQHHGGSYLSALQIITKLKKEYV